MTLLFPKPEARKKTKARRDREDRERMIAWHEAVCERAREGTRYRCYHCRQLFPREKVCGDHYPYSRGSRPDLKYDLDNGVCCCTRCNV
jgi:hypothetical protein